MHDKVSKVYKRLSQAAPPSDSEGTKSELFQKLEHGGLSKALALPLSRNLVSVHAEAFRWLRLSVAATESADRGQTLGEMIFSSRHLHVVLGDGLAFYERAEDNLSEMDDAGNRESAYEREVAHFSKLDSTGAWRDFLSAQPEFTTETVAAGVGIQGDLLKILYLDHRLRNEPADAADLYAMTSELVLDTTHHLLPHLKDGSEFLTALRKASERP